MILTPTQLQSSSFSDLDEAPAEVIGQALLEIVEQASEPSLQSFTGLLLDRALGLLRQGSREAILDEALAVSRGISGAPGEALLARSRETFGAWTLLEQLLAEAGRRRDRAAVGSILLGTRGHGQAILELLAGEGQPVPRSRIKRALALAEAQLSHLLRDLEEADLIVRYRPEKSREVLVALGPVGREVSAASVFPAWVESFIAVLGRIAAGDVPGQEEISRTLLEAGAPSQLAAGRLAEATLQVTAALRPRSTGSSSPPRAEPPGLRIQAQSARGLTPEQQAAWKAA
jgi:DNA-binding MarR family transcriptional regulator